MECREGTSKKFYELKFEGLTLTTRYGRIGCEGRNNEAEMSSREAGNISISLTTIFSSSLC
jgi:predicted DNA-binding WGR domain protein